MKKHKKKDMPRIGFELTRSKTRDLGFSSSSSPDATFFIIAISCSEIRGTSVERNRN